MVETGRVNAEVALKKLFIQVTESHLKKEFSREGVKAALLEIMDLAANIVKSVHNADTGAEVECKAGCHYCCYAQIKLTPAEALLVFSWIEKKFNEQEMALLWKRIKNNRLLTEGKSLKNRVMVKQSSPCIFLKENECSIYPVRPLICRSWTSYSSKACMDAFDSGNHNAEIETSTSSNFIFYLARETVRHLCRSHGVESEPLELPGAMDCCLSNNDPFTQWLQGNHLFEELSVCYGIKESVPSFMEIQVPSFLKRFSLSYKKDCSCIEYFLYSREKKEEISTELILSYDASGKSIHISKFYPEIYREVIPQYMSAACLFLLVHHAASVFEIHCDSFIFLETRNSVFEAFYSRLKDFDFLIDHERISDKCSVRGVFHDLHIETSMIKRAADMAETTIF